MTIPSHALSVDFPEYKDKISQLMTENPEFKTIADEYHKLDEEIRDLEEHDIPTDDQHFHEMKVHRAHLKDKAYYIITTA